VSRYQKKLSPTHTYHGHQSSLISFLVYLLAWHPLLHIPYISSLNHCLLFAAHARTIATCFAAVLLSFFSVCSCGAATPPRNHNLGLIYIYSLANEFEWVSVSSATGSQSLESCKMVVVVVVI